MESESTLNPNSPTVMEHKVLTIIVTYNGMKWMERCLSSVCNSSVASDIYIVDNGSTDGTQDFIKANYPQAIFMQNTENSGFGKANNYGLLYAVDKGYDYVYLLNQDAWVEKDTFKILISQHLSNPVYGILSPIQIQGNGEKMDKNFLNNVASRTIGRSLMEDIYFGNVQEIYEVADVMAAHWMISRECLLATGGFSPAFRHYGEDDNYVDRAIFHGFKAGIVPATKAVHDRETRKDTPASLSYRCGTMALIELSRITGKIRWARIIMKFAQYTYNHGLFRHYKYIFIHLFNLGKILKIRKASRQKGAFLNIG